MSSNMPAGYSDEGSEVAEQGEESEIYEELRGHFESYQTWLTKNLENFWTIEDQRAAANICNEYEKLLASMEGPL